MTEDEIFAHELLATYALQYEPGQWHVLMAALALCGAKGIGPPPWLIAAFDEMALAATQRSPLGDVRTKVTRYRAIRKQMWAAPEGRKRDKKTGPWRPTESAVFAAIIELEGKSADVKARYKAFMKSFTEVEASDTLRFMVQDLRQYPRQKSPVSVRKKTLPRPKRSRRRRMSV